MTTYDMALMPFRLAETAVGIIIGCLPSLPRFFKSVFSVDSSLRRLFSRSPVSRSWRSLFKRSSKFGVSWGPSGPLSTPQTRSKAPKIAALNITRPELDVEEMELLHTSLPRKPDNSLQRSQEHTELQWPENSVERAAFGQDLEAQKIDSRKS